MRWHVELSTTFIDGTTSHTANILLGRPTLNRVGVVASLRHMKMKLPFLEGVVITLKSDQKEAKRCYENNLKTKRGVCAVTTQPPKEEGVTRLEIARERRPEPAEEVLEREIEGKRFKLGNSLGPEAQDQIVEVIAWHNNACPKDSYPVPSINALVYSASGYRLLSFLDAFSGYNQIRMHPRDKCKTTFITKLSCYCYKVKPFGLKNAGVTYQRLMDRILAPMIRRNVQGHGGHLLGEGPARR